MLSFYSCVNYLPIMANLYTVRISPNIHVPAYRYVVSATLNLFNRYMYTVVYN